nr:hypothetical protein FVER53263_20628 [Fusarium verticillioides]
MLRLPPFDKLPVAALKNHFEDQLSKATGIDWKINIDPLAVMPYGAESSWAHTQAHKVSYVEEAIKELERNPKYHDETNKLVSPHVLTMDIDEEETFDACGAKFTSDGKLAIVFGADRLGSNTGDAYWHKNLEKGISLAPTIDALSFYARKGIREEYEPDIADIQSDLEGIIKKDITLVPNFEETYKKVKETKDGTDFDQ